MNLLTLYLPRPLIFAQKKENDISKETQDIILFIKNVHKKSLTIQAWFINGGERGIRTPARFNPPAGFQDQSLQPDLGISPSAYYKWWT